MKKSLILLFCALMFVSCAELLKERERKEMQLVAKLASLQVQGQVIDAGIVCDGCEFENDAMVYNFTVDENLIDFDILKECEADIRAEFEQELKLQSNDNEMFESLRKLDGKIIYRFIGDTTGKTIVLTIDVPN